MGRQNIQQGNITMKTEQRQEHHSLINLIEDELYKTSEFYLSDYIGLYCNNKQQILTVVGRLRKRGYEIKPIKNYKLPRNEMLVGYELKVKPSARYFAAWGRQSNKGVGQ